MASRAARYRMVIGILLGLVGSAVVLSNFGVFQNRASAPPRGPLLSDCDGPIQDLVVHYVAEAAPIVASPYQDFLPQLPARVTVHVVCPEQADFDDLRQRVGPTQCMLSPVIVDHAITPWSRDRWLALEPADTPSTTTLVSPRAEQGAEIWPARAGDQQVADDLAAAPGLGVVSIRSDLIFDGGDFVADTQTAFVTPNVRRQNLQRTVETEEELVEQLATLLNRRIVLLDVAPDHHAGMYMMAVGNKTILLGDPAAARRLLTESSDASATEALGAMPTPVVGMPKTREESPLSTASADRALASSTLSNEDELTGNAAKLCPPEGPDFSEETIARFDAVARRVEAAGYRVVRIPVVPGKNGRTYVTYLNVIVDERNDHRTVYLPTFSQAEVLNRAAEQIWANLGYEVRRVNCDTCYPHFGSLRCLVNVLRRG